MNSNVISLQSLRVEVLPGLGVPQEATNSYLAAYETWKSVWTETLKEVDGVNQLHSDDFTRQDYIVGLFHGPKCVALCCFRRANAAVEVDREDSWFKPWPTAELSKIGDSASRGVVVSWLSVHADYRRTINNEHLKNFSVSQRLCEAINFFLQDCEMDVAFGITRNERSVNQMARYTGFRVHQSNAVHHGEPADLITTNHELLIKAQDSYPEVAFKMWNSRRSYQSAALELRSKEAVPRKLKSVG